MAELQRFSDFNTSPKVLDGTKIKIDEVLDKEIIIRAFRKGESHYKTKEYATVQFTYAEGESKEKHIFFTGSTVVIDQLVTYESKLPFLTIVKKIEKYYTLS